MDRGTDQCEPLFPAPGKCSTDLISPIGQARTLEFLRDAGTALAPLKTVNASVETQVLFDG